MKTFLTPYFNGICCLFIFFIAFTLALPVDSQVKAVPIEPEIQKAYDLRISGKAGEARTVLEKYLQENPGDAMANFEMARLLRTPGGMPDMESVLKYSSKAIQAEPENPYYAFNHADFLFLNAFISVMTGDTITVIRERMEETCSAFENVLELDPECNEAYMYLIDIHAILPEEMGAVRSRAEQYSHALEELDPFYSAWAQLMLVQDSVEEIGYWKKYMEEKGEDARAMERLGRAYLMAGDPGNAEEILTGIIEKDPSKSSLYLDLARGYLVRIMQSQEVNDEDLAGAREYFNRYLKNESAEPVCRVAWTYGMLSNLEQRSGNQELSETYAKKAAELDPYFSRAFAYPALDDPPNRLIYRYSSYFRPF